MPELECLSDAVELDWGMQSGLFDDVPQPPIELAEGAVLLPSFLGGEMREVLAGLKTVSDQSPFRNMVTPSGREMSVAMTNCGPLGWVSDEAGYRYQAIDPLRKNPWPEIPKRFVELAESAAKTAGFPEFTPDSCLINRYEIGSRLSLHQDKDEADFEHPIVSVSLGLPAVFLLGGFSRADPKKNVSLSHGDVVVWGGPSRLRYHGVKTIKDGYHPVLGPFRFNFTFRRAN